MLEFFCHLIKLYSLLVTITSRLLVYLCNKRNGIAFTVVFTRYFHFYIILSKNRHCSMKPIENGLWFMDQKSVEEEISKQLELATKKICGNFCWYTIEHA